MANGGRAQYLSQALQCGAVVCPDADTGVHRKPAVLAGIGHKIVVPAIITPGPGKAMRKGGPQGQLHPVCGVA